jgi:hypothetical protein
VSGCDGVPGGVGGRPGLFVGGGGAEPGYYVCYDPPLFTSPASEFQII